MKILKFNTRSCIPCKQYAPIFDSVIEKFPDIKVERIDADKNPAEASKYRIMSVPYTMIVSDTGVIMFQKTGPIPAEELEKEIREHFKI